MTNRWVPAIGALGALLLLAGCGQIPPVQTAHLTSVPIARHKTPWLKPLHVTVTNRHLVNTLYRDIRALKPFPSGTMSCPADFGIDYTLKFKSKRRVVLTATADPTGCSEVKLSTGQSLWGIGRAGQAFWAALATTLDMKHVHDLWPRPPASGP